MEKGVRINRNLKERVRLEVYQRNEKAKTYEKQTNKKNNNISNNSKYNNWNVCNNKTKKYNQNRNDIRITKNASI